MHPDSEMLIPYRMRTVRIGLVVTVLVLLALVALPLLPDPPPIHQAGYWAILAAAACGGIVVLMLPWRRLFERGLGVRFLYAWSIADILLVALGVAATGGGRSDLFALFGLTTVFLAASYPRRGQVALLLFTAATYVAAVGATGWHIGAASLFIRLSALATLGVMASFLAGELMVQMGAEKVARDRSERWASMLSTIAATAREMSLDPNRVVDAVFDAVIGLGFEGVGFSAIDHLQGTFRVVHARGLPGGYDSETYPASAGVAGLVLSDGETVIVDDYPSQPDAIPMLVEAGFRSVIASPIWLDGWLAAVLVGASRTQLSFSTQEVEAFELVAQQGSMALQNARRFEEEHRAVERLEELDRMKSDFLATVSHELRTPMTVIEGSGLTLERTWDDIDEPIRRELLHGLNSNARSLRAIITNLLDFSRLETGHLEMRFGPLDLSELLAGAAERLAPLLREHHVILDVAPTLRVHGDAVLLDRVIENLLSNAAKHTPRGTLVRVGARREPGEVVVEVADRGPGIDEDELLHLGERFYRGGDLNTRPKGLGLGLALIGEVLQLHGAELRVTSRVGEGSTFSFRLPSLGPDGAGDAQAEASAT